MKEKQHNKKSAETYLVYLTKHSKLAYEKMYNFIYHRGIKN